MDVLCTRLDKELRWDVFKSEGDNNPLLCRVCWSDYYQITISNLVREWSIRRSSRYYIDNVHNFIRNIAVM